MSRGAETSEEAVGPPPAKAREWQSGVVVDHGLPALQVEDEAVNVSAIKTNSKRQARQYMNRRGGFNRPLPVERTNEKVLRD